MHGIHFGIIPLLPMHSPKPYFSVINYTAHLILGLVRWFRTFQTIVCKKEIDCVSNTK